MSELITRRTSLPGHIVQFCRFLRAHKFGCGPREESDALRAIARYLPPEDEGFEVLLRATLAKGKDEFLKFPALYREYWGQLARAENDKIQQQVTEAEQRKNKAKQPPSIDALKDWLYNGRQSKDETELAAYTAVETFVQKDFSAFSSVELKEITEVLRRLAHLLYREDYRRQTKAHRPGQLDIRRSIRENIARGGNIEIFHWQQPKPTRQRISLFCDVSKSMDLYARFLIQFMYGLHLTGVQLETFVFSTSLTRITPALVNRDFDASLDKIGELVDHWSGGTNLGKSLQQFRKDYGQKYLGSKTSLIILSDGWDQGDATTMDLEMHYLRKHAQRLIWINPLAGRPGYEPRTRGMETALPYLDHFTSAHNLESLVALVRYLGG